MKVAALAFDKIENRKMRCGGDSALHPVTAASLLRVDQQNRGILRLTTRADRVRSATAAKPARCSAALFRRRIACQTE
jgi:hypothetical protein